MAQQRAVATRAAVLLAAARVFERHGYAATISQILDEAGVTKGAMYFHFDSKESLAAAIVAEQSNWRQGNIEPAQCPFQRVVDISHRFVRALTEDVLVRASIRLTLERNTFGAEDPSPYTDWFDAIREMLEEAAQVKDLLPRVAPEAAARLIVSAVTGLQLISEAQTRRADIKERLLEMWEVLAPALVTPHALAHLDLTGSPGAASAPSQASSAAASQVAPDPVVSDRE